MTVVGVAPEVVRPGRIRRIPVVIVPGFMGTEMKDESGRQIWPNMHRALANPEISGLDDELVAEEGCLSIRGPYAETPRAFRLHARGLTLDGEPVEFDAEALLARIMQHETDHLDGKLFIDRITDEARREVMRQLREQDFTGRSPQRPSLEGSGGS